MIDCWREEQAILAIETLFVRTVAPGLGVARDQMFRSLDLRNRLTGGVFLETSFTAPWCVTSHIGPEDCRPHLTNTASVISFHYVISGRLHVAVGGEDPLDVGGNTIVLLPRNDAHLLASGPGIPPVDSHLLIRTEPNGALSSIEHGGGGEATRIVCGFVGSESQEHPLFNALPRVMAMNLDGRPGSDCIARSFQHAAQEVASGRPAAGTVLAKLSELLFVEALREYTAGLPLERTGWLAALRDPAIGRALARMHAHLAHPWTAEALAAEALLSRSAFADRFTQLLDVPPMSSHPLAHTGRRAAAARDATPDLANRGRRGL